MACFAGGRFARAPLIFLFSAALLIPLAGGARATPTPTPTPTLTGVLSPIPGSAVPLGQVFMVTFDGPVQGATVNTAFTLTKILDGYGLPVNVLVAGTITSDPPGKVYTFTPTAPLDGNSRYRVDVTTAVLRVGGTPLAAALSGEYPTVIDERQPAVFVTPGGVRIDLPAGALPLNATLRASSPPPGLMAAATAKLLLASSDERRQPVGEAVDLKVVDVGGVEQPGVFPVPVTISFPFSDDGNGFVTGSNPRVRVSSLKIYWLDEGRDAWVRLPSSRVDRAAGRVLAETPHFTIFADMGGSSNDLSEAFAFPVPVRRSAPDAKITFTQLGDDARIRLLTVAGEEVVSLHETDGDGRHDWDLRNSAGELVAPGVYHYLITSGSEVKRGKVVILP